MSGRLNSWGWRTYGSALCAIGLSAILLARQVSPDSASRAPKHSELTLVALTLPSDQDKPSLGTFRCTGLLVGSNIVTARHCVGGPLLWASFIPTAGEWTTARLGPESAATAAQLGDVIVMQTDIEVGNESPSEGRLGANSIVWIQVWRGLEDFKSGPSPKSIPYQVLSESACLNAGGDVDMDPSTPSLSCLRPMGPEGICTGDSGAPVFTESGLLAAVVSGATDCRPGAVAFVTAVTAN